MIVFGVHPGDCDNKAGGTAIKFPQMGHKVKNCFSYQGDVGQQSLSAEALVKVRKAESKEAGKSFGV